MSSHNICRVIKIQELFTNLRTIMKIAAVVLLCKQKEKFIYFADLAQKRLKLDKLSSI